MYPLLSSSLSHFRRASSSLGGNGYSLQSIVSGASGFRVIAWSHGLEGGNFLTQLDQICVRVSCTLRELLLLA